MKYGDTVRLTDGRTGTVTFVDRDSIRFFPAGKSVQSWEWVRVGDITQIQPCGLSSWFDA